MAAGFAKQKPRRQPTAEEVRQVKRREPDRQQREDEERFILQTQLQRKANFHAVQEPSVDWNQPYPEERHQSIRTSQPVVPKTQPAAQDAEQPSEDPTSRIEHRLNLMLEETRRKLISFNDEGPQEYPRYQSAMEVPRYSQQQQQYLTIVNPQYREQPFFSTAEPRGDAQQTYGGFQSARERQGSS